jgi:hypothetical protein
MQDASVLDRAQRQGCDEAFEPGAAVGEVEQEIPELLPVKKKELR